MKKQFVAAIMLCLIGGIAMAQNERDAFRYAQYSPTGTARYTSLAGSMGAFGADFSVLSANNPAGIGLFKRAEVTLTLAVPYFKTTSTYNGVSQEGIRTGFMCNNVGFVIPFNLSEKTKWKAIQFATGLNNLAQYRGEIVVRGLNDGEEQGTSNYFDYIASYSNGTRFTALEGLAGTAFDYYLIDTVSGDNQYHALGRDVFNQQKISTSNGSLNEWVFSFGGNYDDKLFVGATVGVPFFNYNETTIYTETADYDNLSYDQFTVTDEFKSSATGINFKLGLIYQPAKYVRVGLAFHTPTAYLNVKDEWFQTQYEFLGLYNPIDSSRSDLKEPKRDSEKVRGTHNYQLNTPFRAMANVAFIINKYGFINIDYELTDYSKSHLQSNIYDFVSENNAVKDYYGLAHTIRAGGELNLSPFALRLGYSYTSNPYTKNLEKNGSSHTICGGVGFKSKSFFADFAYMYRFTNDKDVLYDAASVHPHSSRIVNQVFALTLGLKMGK